MIKNLQGFLIFFLIINAGEIILLANQATGMEGQKTPTIINVEPAQEKKVLKEKTDESASEKTINDEFTPTQQISEDFAVPFPTDI